MRQVYIGLLWSISIEYDGYMSVRWYAFVIPVYLLLCTASPVHAYVVQASKSAELSATARVLPRPIDFQFNLASSLDGAMVGADTEIEYTITYGSLLSYATPMTIEAQWSLGSIPTENLYAFSIVSYVAGSATKDYWGETTPVVDVAHRKITWTIRSYPRNTIDKTLRFRLKTPGRYVTDRQVHFTVSARLTTPEYSHPERSLEQVYNPTDFIRKQVRGTVITALDIRSITDTSFVIYLATSVPTRAIITYGTDPENLNQSIEDTALTDQKFITISGLKPLTKYYFKVLIENDKLIQRRTPEVFEVTTSASSLLSLVDRERVIITSRGVLLNIFNAIGYSSRIMVPTEAPVVLYIPFKIQVPNLVYLSVVNQRVLGLSTDTTPIPVENIRFLEAQAGVYTGSVTAPKTPGVYDIMIETRGTDGEINRDILTTLVVSPPIRVTDQSGRPVEKALVYFQRFSSTKQTFEHFPAETYGGRNPTYTESDGSVFAILPAGEYVMTINAPGFKSREDRFSFSPVLAHEYPQIVLDRAPFSLMSYVEYYINIILDSAKYFSANIDTLASSWRFLDFSVVVSLVVLTGLSTLLNLRRIRMSAEALIIRWEFFLLKLFGRNRNKFVFVGFVRDLKTALPVHNASVVLSHKEKRVWDSRSVTDMLGKFTVILDPQKEYTLVVKKQGFAPAHGIVDAEFLSRQQPVIELKPIHVRTIPTSVQFAFTLAYAVLDALSDTLLVVMLVLHGFFIGRVGIVRLLPLSVLALCNVLLWIEFQWVRFRAKQSAGK